MLVEKIPERFREDRTRVNWIGAFFLLRNSPSIPTSFEVLAQLCSNRKLSFIAHKELLMFQNKTSCRLTTTSHTTRDDDDARLE